MDTRTRTTLSMTADSAITGSARVLDSPRRRPFVAHWAITRATSGSWNRT